MVDEILICTKPNDEHAQLISVGLEEFGIKPTLFYASKMPVFESHSSYFSNDESTFLVDDKEILSKITNYKRIWLRRIGSSSHDLLNIDENDYRYVTSIISMYTRSLFKMMDNYFAGSDIMVNSYGEKISGESKMLQLMEAKRCGLSIPSTIVSNNYDHIKKFQDDHKGRIICKSLISQTWKGKETVAFAYTSIMPHMEDFLRDTIKIHPAIYQGYIDKSFEVRVIIFGGVQFGIVIDSQNEEATRIDWRARRLFKNNNELHMIPEDVFNRCILLMEKLGIKYGAFDFIVKPDGNYVFLEINEAGQFLFVEDCCPQHKIADAFCHFLIHGDLKNWNESNPKVTIESLLSSEKFKERMSSDSVKYSYDRAGMTSAMGNGVGSLRVDYFPE